MFTQFSVRQFEAASQKKLAEEERQRQLAEQEKQRQRLAEEEKQRQLIQQANEIKAEKNKQLAEAYFANAGANDRNRAYSQQAGLVIYYGTEAIKSYTNFIKLASPVDGRISEAQDAIANIQNEINSLSNQPVQAVQPGNRIILRHY